MPEEPKVDADQPPNNTPYVIALVVMAILGISSVLFITVMRQDQDNTALITIVLGFIVTITGSVMQFMKTEQTHQTVNSRMGKLIELTRKDSKTEGLKEGVEEGQGNNVD